MRLAALHVELASVGDRQHHCALLLGEINRNATTEAMLDRIMNAFLGNPVEMMRDKRIADRNRPVRHIEAFRTEYLVHIAYELRERNRQRIVFGASRTQTTRQRAQLADGLVGQPHHLLGIVCLGGTLGLEAVRQSLGKKCDPGQMLSHAVMELDREPHFLALDGLQLGSRDPTHAARLDGRRRCDRWLGLWRPHGTRLCDDAAVTPAIPSRLESGAMGLVYRGFQMSRMVQCIKLGREAEGLDFAPYPGELGKRILENVSKEAWAAWLKQQTMLVNENRLNLADARARKYLLQQVERHFFGGGADVAQGYVPPSN